MPRNIIFRLLRRIEHGQITINEDQLSFTFGQQDTEDRVTIEVNNPRVYRRLLLGGTVAAGESYIDRDWDTSNLTGLIQIMIRNMQVMDFLDDKLSYITSFGNRLKHMFSFNSERGSKKNIASHYDLGNDFYRLFLDRTMTYSSAIFPDHQTTLEQAQKNKFDAVCQRIGIRPGDQVVEIGSGWGGFAIHAATEYQARVTTTTISQQQHNYCSELIARLGLEDRITLLKQDYRELKGSFDKLVSIEMIEAVGHSYLPSFFRKCSDLLKPSGKMLIQAITINDQRYDRYRRQTDFIQRYIFPGGFLPSLFMMNKQLKEQSDMRVSAVHDLGLDYAHTLRLWSRNLLANRESLDKLELGEGFYRMWQFYLNYCEGGFRERLISTIHYLAEKPRYRSDDRPILLAG